MARLPFAQGLRSALSRVTGAVVRSGRSARLAAWTCVFVATAVFASLRAIGAVASDGVFAVSQLLFAGALWTSVAGTAMAWGASHGADDNRLWSRLLLATIALAVGGTYYSCYQVFIDVGGPPALSPFDVLSAVGTLLFAWALLERLVHSWDSRLMGALRGVDAVAIFVVLSALGYAVASWLLQGVDPVQVLGPREFIYALIGVGILATVAGNTAGFGRHGWSSWQLVLMVVLAVYGLAVALWPLSLHMTGLADDVRGEVAIAATLFFAHALMLVAGIYRVAGPSSGRTGGQGEGPSFRGRVEKSSLALSTVLFGTTLVLAILSLRTAPGTVDSRVYLVGMGLLGVLMVARTTMEATYLGTLRERAGSDPVTGLQNLKSIQARVSEGIREYRRYGDPLSLVVFDLDDFERLNTLYGSMEGDRLLREVGVAVTTAVGRQASVGRIGGDEFGVVLIGATTAEAVGTAETMRDALHRVLTSAGLPLTASWGVANCPEHSTSEVELLKRADAAQYWAKRHGKDRVVAFDEREAGAYDHAAHVVLPETRAELDVLLAVVIGSEGREAAARYHSRNVAALAVRVAESLFLPAHEVRDVEIAALLHDLGKVGVADEVLLKGSPRTRAEEMAYREHVLLGERLIAATAFGHIAPAVRAHHERWDGSGFPDGLAKDDIPIAARVVAACDSFERMAVGRNGGHARSKAAAMHELDQGMGTAFDPEVVEALIGVVGSLPSEGWLEKEVSW